MLQLVSGVPLGNLASSLTIDHRQTFIPSKSIQDDLIDTMSKTQTAEQKKATAFQKHAAKDKALKPVTVSSRDVDLTPMERRLVRLAEILRLPPTYLSLAVFLFVPIVVGFVVLHRRFWKEIESDSEGPIDLNLDKDLLIPVLVTLCSVFVGFYAGSFAARFNTQYIRVLNWFKTPRRKTAVPEIVADKAKTKKEK